MIKKNKLVMERKPIYVTFSIRPSKHIWPMEHTNRYYAIKCDTMDNAMEAMSDVKSIADISYLRINKCGRIRKDAKVILYGSYYIGEL